MTKFTAFVGAVLAVAAATIIVIKYQSQFRQLSEDTQRDQLSNLAAENVRLSNLVELTSHSETRTNEPPARELLRLRGEVARLHHEQNEAEDLRQEKEEEINKLRRQIQQLSGQSFREMYGVVEIDTNDVPEFRLRRTTNEVFAGLQRVGAEILAYQDKFGQRYIHANVFPKADPTTNANFAVSMEFYFDDGKLTSKKWQRTSHP